MTRQEYKYALLDLNETACPLVKSCQYAGPKKELGWWLFTAKGPSMQDTIHM